MLQLSQTVAESCGARIAAAPITTQIVVVWAAVMVGTQSKCTQSALPEACTL